MNSPFNWIDLNTCKKVHLKILQNSQNGGTPLLEFNSNDVAGLAVNFTKKKLQHSCFPANFAKMFKNTFLTEHLQMTVSCAYIWILRSFSEHFFYRTPLGLLISCAKCMILASIHSNFSVGTFQTFCIITISIYWKVFI